MLLEDLVPLLGVVVLVREGLVDVDGTRGAGLPTGGEEGLDVEIGNPPVPRGEGGRHRRRGGGGRWTRNSVEPETCASGSGGGRGNSTMRADLPFYKPECVIISSG